MRYWPPFAPWVLGSVRSEELGWAGCGPGSGPLVVPVVVVVIGRPRAGAEILDLERPGHGTAPRWPPWPWPRSDPPGCWRCNGANMGQ
jgi:hypothetical protein